MNYTNPELPAFPKYDYPDHLPFDTETKAQTQNVLHTAYKSGSRLIPPSQQFQTLQQQLGVASGLESTPPALSRSLMQAYANKIQPTTANWMDPHYQSLAIAQQDRQTMNAHMQEHMAQQQKYAQQAELNDVHQACVALPPLPLRFADPSLLQAGYHDSYFPVKIGPRGQIYGTPYVPDLMINFHAFSQAINVYLCTFDPKRQRDYEMAIESLYTINPNLSEDPVTLSEFEARLNRAWERAKKRSGMQTESSRQPV